MTQPQQPQDQAPYLVLGTAAATLALVALESRIREETEDAINGAFLVFTALIIAALASPLAVIATGLALMSRDDVHTGLVRLTDATRDKIAATVQAAYSAAAAIAQQKATRDLAAYGYTVPNTLPPLGSNIDRLLTDIDLMFGHTQTDIQNTIIAAFNPADDPTTQARTIRDVINAAAARITQRALATTTVAVHTGAYDAQQAIYDAFQLHTGRANLMKRWTVTSVTPCGMCAALDGTMVGLSGEFDHQATLTGKDLRTPWRGSLQGPPRHPNCRCTIELVQT